MNAVIQMTQEIQETKYHRFYESRFSKNRLRGRKQEIVQRLKDKVTKDERLKMILEPLQKLSDEIPELKLKCE